MAAPKIILYSFCGKGTDKTHNTPLVPTSTVQTSTDKTPACLGFVTDKTSLSASWVLVDLFDVSALELLTPDHVLAGLELFIEVVRGVRLQDIGCKVGVR